MVRIYRFTIYRARSLFTIADRSFSFYTAPTWIFISSPLENCHTSPSFALDEDTKTGCDDSFFIQRDIYNFLLEKMKKRRRKIINTLLLYKFPRRLRSRKISLKHQHTFLYYSQFSKKKERKKKMMRNYNGSNNGTLYIYISPDKSFPPPSFRTYPSKNQRNLEQNAGRLPPRQPFGHGTR